MRRDFGGELWTQCPETAIKMGLNWVHGTPGKGLGRDGIHFGGNSGYQAMNLAYLMNASRIYLLGYDMQKIGCLSHWHGDHPRCMPSRQAFDSWVLQFDALASDLKAEGVQVVNLSRETALSCFDRAGIEVLND